MKKTFFLIYAWGSTILFGALIYWLATLPYLNAGDRVADELIKVIFRMTLYAILFILFYRSCIMTLKSSVERLSTWRSKNEKHQDAEFVLIIETLVVIITILATILFSIFEEYTQSLVEGRASEVKDILISIMTVFLTAIVVYSMPVIGELEFAIKHKIQDRNNRNNS
jgi:NADH:ubiquinone oxidoreductase subunit 6 (subunit J)